MSDHYWDTDEELGFLGILASRRNAEKLLKGYITGSRRRVVWGPISRETVVERAYILLGKMGETDD